MATTQTTNILSDLSTLIHVPVKTLNDIMSKIALCIGSAVHDAILTEQDVLIANIGLGTLSINVKDMQCKFVPGKEFKSIIKKSINEKIDPLEITLERALAEKLIKCCEEVL